MKLFIPVFGAMQIIVVVVVVDRQERGPAWNLNNLIRLYQQSRGNQGTTDIFKKGFMIELQSI